MNAALPPDVLVRADMPDLDEDFLHAVDRAMQLAKQNDPWRLGQVHRALEEEAYLADAFGQGQLDHRPPPVLLEGLISTTGGAQP